MRKVAVASFAAAALGLAVVGGCGKGEEPPQPGTGGASKPWPVSTYVAADDVQTTEDLLKQVDAYIAEKKIDRQAPNWRLRLPDPPSLRWPAGKKVVWLMETGKGRLEIELFPDKAPRHVASNVYLNRLGFYDGLVFHRVIRGFMAQGGCPRGDGSAGPGYQLPFEGSPNVRHNRRGVLSAARTTEVNSAHSQFFLTFQATPALDTPPGGKEAGYTVYGQLIGDDTALKGLEAIAAPTDGMPPQERVVIERTAIEVR